ncbi:dihydrofolate reductase family protein [Microbacterium sp. LjRoot45]|uniref:dihydrofolate reductase family protein n=1 Tax=Microbacterium sp. LjRoot45 TaxID=3342329 RepID=UPI003F508F60
MRPTAVQPLRYAINVTLDGCCHHEAGLPPDAESMAFWTDELRRSDTLLYGRVTYEMMQSAWRRPASGVWPDWMDAADIAFADVIDAIPKSVVSNTLEVVDWNAERTNGDLRTAVEALKARPGRGISLGGVALPAALAELGLIDEYTFVVHPVVAGRGPRLLDGLHDQLALELVERREFASGAVAQRYRPAAVPIGTSVPTGGSGA